jgi:hypothetical protein
MESYGHCGRDNGRRNPHDYWTMASERFDFSAAVNIHSPAGCVINYQERTV